MSMSLAEILLVDDPNIRKATEATIAAADRIHRFPKISPIPLVSSRSRTEEGAYHFASRPLRPLKIVISRYARHPSWTLLHEIGHLLDNTVLNSPGLVFGSDGGRCFENLLGIWRADPHLRSLHRLLMDRGRRAGPASRNALRYELSGGELWARTYVQWMAARSGHAAGLSTFRTTELADLL